MKQKCIALLITLSLTFTMTCQPLRGIAADISSDSSAYDNLIAEVIRADSSTTDSSSSSLEWLPPSDALTSTEDTSPILSTEDIPPTDPMDAPVSSDSSVDIAVSDQLTDDKPTQPPEDITSDPFDGDSSPDAPPDSSADTSVPQHPEQSPSDSASDVSSSPSQDTSEQTPDTPPEEKPQEKPQETTKPPQPETTSLEQRFNKSKKITLSYDDRYTFKSDVSKIETVKVTSNQIGSGKKDTSILKKDSKNAKKVIVCGCGKAVVTLKDGSVFGITAEAAPISLLLIAGQSNAEGSLYQVSQKSSLQKQWIVNQEGQVYNTYAPSSTDRFGLIGWFTSAKIALSTKNVSSYIPKSLTDNSSSLQYQRTNNLTNASAARGKSGIDSALGYRWHQLTGEKVWIVNAAHGGSSIKTWQPSEKETNNNYWQAVKLYQQAEKLLSKEISAGHYTLSHKGVFWCQGEADRQMSASDYNRYFRKMYQKGSNGFAATLNGSGIQHLNKNIEFIGITMVRAASKTPTNSSDLALTGPRIAQYYMCGSSNYDIVYLASQAEESWTTNTAVKNYFKSKYGTKSAYLKANPMKNSSPSLPTKVSQIHPAIHYTQLGFNEIGRDAAENICYALGYAKAPSSKVSSIQLVTANGYTNRTGKRISLANGQKTSFAVKVYPTYLSKGVTCSSNNQLTYTASGLKKSGTAKTATLKVSCHNKTAKLTVKKS